MPAHLVYAGKGPVKGLAGMDDDRQGHPARQVQLQHEHLGLTLEQRVIPAILAALVHAGRVPVVVQAALPHRDQAAGSGAVPEGRPDMRLQGRDLLLPMAYGILVRPDSGGKGEHGANLGPDILSGQQVQAVPSRLRRDGVLSGQQVQAAGGLLHADGKVIVLGAYVERKKTIPGGQLTQEAGPPRKAELFYKVMKMKMCVGIHRL